MNDAGSVEFSKLDADRSTAPSTSMEIRRLCPDHADALAQFFMDLKSHGRDQFFHPHPLNVGTVLKLVNHRGDDLYYVIVSEAKVIGYGMLRGWDEGYDIPSLGIAIHPSVEGRGLAHLLMDFLRHAALARGATRIRLRVHRTNERGHGFFRSLGYVLSDDDDHRYMLGFLNLD